MTAVQVLFPDMTSKTNPSAQFAGPFAVTPLLPFPSRMHCTRATPHNHTRNLLSDTSALPPHTPRSAGPVRTVTITSSEGGGLCLALPCRC